MTAATLQTGSIALVCVILIAVALGRWFTQSLTTPTPFFPKWIAVWLTISSLVCLWDATFVLNRSTSLDSFNNPVWQPYQDYVKVDKLYGKLDSDFVWSQSILNLLEILLNLYALYLLSVKKFKAASVTALVVCAMTSSKTILYHVMEISCDGCNTKQNDWATFITLYVIPNGVWIWVPMWACVVLGTALAGNGIDLEEAQQEEEEEKDRVRGKCSVCQEDVHVSEHRGKDHQGNWYHEECVTEMMANGSLLASDVEDDEDDEEEEEEEEEVVVAPKKKSSRSTRANSKGRASSTKKKKKATPVKKTGKYNRTTTLVENLRHPEKDEDVSLVLRPRHRTTRSSTRSKRS